MKNTQSFVLKPNLDKQWDFTPAYRWILEQYSAAENCPALLFLDIPISANITNIFGDRAILIDKETGSHLNRLKRVHSMKDQLYQEENFDFLLQYWDPSLNYKILYSFCVDICDHLDIPMPAIFFSNKMPEAFSGYHGVVLPGGARSNVSDIFIKYDSEEIRILGTLLHELRHVWQHKYHNDWFYGYRSADHISKKEYYQQFVEIDAAAFQYWTLEEYGYKFMLEDLGKTRCAAIKKRMEELSKTETLPSLRYLSKV